jgi:polysaccharide biosynthesis transport protein
VLSSSLVASIKSEIIKIETKLLELTSRLGEKHPQVIETRAALADLKGKLDIETRRVTGSVGVSNTITKQRETELRAAVEAQRAKVLRMKQTRDEIAVMQKDVEAAQRAYDGVQTRLNQSTLESQNQQSNISVLNQAEVPNETKTQIFLKNAAKALIAALGLALLAGFVREFFDRRVRSVMDIQPALNLPVIGIMPRPDKSSWLKGSMPSLQQSRLLRQLPHGK